MATNKNFKFLFCNFNDYLNRRGLLTHYVKHILVYDDVHDLLELQERDWPYFIRRLFGLS